jgi:predicted DNA-binding transcriptional regulator AlpA
MTKRVIHTQGEAGDSGAERTESLWTPKQTAAYLGVSVKTLYRWHYLKENLQPKVMGGRLRYSPESVKQWFHDLP